MVGGYDGEVTRFRPTAAALAVMTTCTVAPPAFADVGPPLAPPVLVAPPAPSPLDFALDALIPSVASYVALRYVVGGAPAPMEGVAPTGNALLAGAVMLAGLSAPPAALIAYRERPFAFDMLLASFAGGMVGLGIGFGAARLASGGAAAPEVLALSMAACQGLGAATAYHLYRGHKATATDLDRLPAQRKDDPIDNWKFWRERRNP